MKITTILSLGVLLGSALCAAEKPNLLFFLLDDQGKSHTGAYGNPHVPTPSLDAFAKQGMLFHNVHAPMAICAPSRSALYTGQYPFKNGCFQNHWTTWSNTKSITQRMKALGYDVILAGKSHVQPGSVFNWTMHLQGRFREDRAFYPRKGVPLDALENYFSKTNAGNKRPFCIIVASEYPHSPFAEKSDFDPKNVVMNKWVPDTPGNRKREAAIYQNIKNGDDEFKATLELLDKYGLSDNTIVFHSSDHGGLKTGGKYKIYERSLNVPFMVRWPGVIKPGTESHALISFVDVLPTMIELGGGEPSTEMDGNSFVNVLRGKASDHSQYVYGVMTSQGTMMSTVFPGRSIRSKQFKYIRNFNALEVVNRKEEQGEEVHPIIRHGAEFWAKTSPTEDELYDILKDPDEENNLASDPDYAGVINELRNKLQEWMVEQNDFLAKPGFMPIIKCKLPHRVDIYSNNRKVPEHLQNILDDFEDWYVHEQR